MAHKESLKAWDCSLKDLRGNAQTFRGELMLSVRDFLQTLSVIQRATAADELNVPL